MNRLSRRAFSLFDLLVCVAILALLLGLLLPAIVRTREAANRIHSQNNLKQLALGCLNYESTYLVFPAGNDGNHFSVVARLLPYCEQIRLYQQIDFAKPIDVEPNAQVRRMPLPFCTNPTDPILVVKEGLGPTNYLFCAGSKPDLIDNNGVFYEDSKVGMVDITDGTSNTIIIAETTKGNAEKKPASVITQHVGLGRDSLNSLNDESGLQDWQQSKNIVADRGASWMDGRFLQGTFTGTRVVNDQRPDVNCDGLGGLSGPRSYLPGGANVAYGDGHVQSISPRTKLEIWKLLTARNDGKVIPADFDRP